MQVLQANANDSLRNDCGNEELHFQLTFALSSLSILIDGPPKHDFIS